MPKIGRDPISLTWSPKPQSSCNHRAVPISRFWRGDSVIFGEPWIWASRSISGNHLGVSEEPDFFGCENREISFLPYVLGSMGGWRTLLNLTRTPKFRLTWASHFLKRRKHWILWVRKGSWTSKSMATGTGRLGNQNQWYLVHVIKIFYIKKKSLRWKFFYIKKTF